MRAVRVLLAVVLAGVLLPCAPARAGSVPINPFGRPGDLHLDFPTYLSGAAGSGDLPTASVRPVGDVDGDGRADLAVALSSFDTAWETTTWVTFLPAAAPWTADVGGPGWAGLRIVGAGTSTSGIAGVGDVNEDGYGDVALTSFTGTWVVFGGPVSRTVDVRDLGDEGFTIVGARSCGVSSGGSVWTGSLTRSTAVVGVGDQNGDGRSDLALCDARAVRIVYPPPDPAGAVVDLDSGSDASASIRAGTDVSNLAIATAGDGDGDGRAELVVGWSARGGGAHVLGLPAPAPGTELTLGEARSLPRAFELVAGHAWLESLDAVGDHDGDGRGDVSLSVIDPTARRRLVAYAPAPGTRGALLPLTPTTGRELRSWASQAVDVGDQDGDGRPDVAYGADVELSSGGIVSIDQRLPECVTLEQFGSAHLAMCTLEHEVAGVLPDANGDGKPELVAVHADPLPLAAGARRATWRLDVFHSALAPVPQAVEPPVARPDGAIDFAGAFLTAPNGPTRTLAARATVQVTDDAGRTTTAEGDLVDAGAAGTTRAAVRADAGALGLVPGGTYTFRMAMENGRGLTGTTAASSFVYRPPGDGPLPARPAELPITGPSPATPRGTARAVRLVGTARADVLRGRGGDDVLLGRSGPDRLDGGPGRDRLDGGLGDDRLVGGPGRDRLRGGPGRDRLLAADGVRDVVDCGRGRDAAVVDRRDRVAGCERVTRRRATRP